MSKKSKYITSEDIIVNEFTEESAAKFREQVLKKASHGDDYPIIIYIDSYGGYVDALASMVETIQSVPNPIITVALGKAMSCGAILLSFGAVRFCGRFSKIMIHEVSAGALGNIHDLKNTAEEVSKVNEFWIGLLAENCGLKGGYRALRKIIKEKDGKDIYLTPQQAVEFGLVDIVGMPTLNAVEVYELYTLPEKGIAGRKAKSSSRSKTTKNKDGKETATGFLFIQGEKRPMG